MTIDTRQVRRKTGIDFKVMLLSMCLRNEDEANYIKNWLVVSNEIVLTL